MRKLILILLASLCPASASAAPVAVDAQYAQLLALDDELLRQGEHYDLKRLASEFDRWQPQLKLRAMSDAEVDMQFRAARLVSGRTFSKEHVRCMRNAYDEMRQRGIARSLHTRQMAAMYVAAREFSSARRLNQLLPPEQRIDIPKLVGSTSGPRQPALLSLEGTAPDWVLRRQPAQLKGRHVVILASPACSFSQKFFERAAASEELSNLVGQALITLPQTTNLLLQDVGSWNRNNPRSPMTYIDATAQWPMIDWWGTPSFYFLDDGKVSTKIVGWQPGVTEQQLLTAYRNWRSQAGAD